jgi:16S rRNA (guanine527-N7)-methyltransferase
LVDFWERHIIDSVQIFPHIPSNAIKFLDIGSGGGLPAIVLAILSAELSPDRRFTLVESDQRKSAFLREAVRTLGLTAEILPVRAEALDPRGAEVLSARALAPLAKLLISAQRHLAEGGVCIFPKGESFRQEIAEAEAQFHFEYDAIPSMTDPRGAILKIHGIRNA